MIFAILVMLTALSISAVAIYYSVAGLVAIFAAAAIPIMIMGGVLEISKLVTAVWLHRYWKQATWWLKSYLSVAVIVLMFITSMGIFGFLSKAHIEQTSASQESVAQVERLTTEIARQEGIVARAEERIQNLQNNGVGADANIQSQIDKEQERIDLAFERIAPAIEQQNKIIEDARTADGSRTKPYEDQLANIQAEILRLEESARSYESSISGLEVDSSNVEPLLAQIANLEEEIIRVTNQINSGEQQQIRAGQAIIGVTSDGLFGGNTRTALAAWVSAQRDRIGQIQGEVAQVRRDAQGTVDAERDRLAGVVKDIRERQIPALKDRELTMLGKIDEVRQTESPAIATARDEIQRLRKSAEDQVANSQTLIERLRAQLAQEDKAAEIETAIDEQTDRIRTANAEIDTLTEEKYALEAEYRKLEAEVGPIKYLAEFIYGTEADQDLLEEAVRWVIIIIIFVFDPLAVLLLIASQYTFEINRKRKDDLKEGHRPDWREYEQSRAQRIVDNPGFDIEEPAPLPAEEEKVDETSDRSNDEQSDRADDGIDTGDNSSNAGDDIGTVEGHDQSTGAGHDGGDDSDRVDEGEKVDDTEPTTTTDTDLRDMVSEADTTVADAVDTELEQPEVQADAKTPIPPTRNKFFYKEELEEQSKKKITSESSEGSKEVEEQRSKEYDEKELDPKFQTRKNQWKQANPDQTLKMYKDLYIRGVIDKLPWEETSELGYVQNSEQSDGTLFNKLRGTSDKN